MGRIPVVAALVFLLFTFSADAETWYVKPDGAGDVPTIQAAVDTAAPGDTVLLASGIFTGTGNVHMVVPAKDISITSETGDPEDCVIDCEGHLGSPRRGFLFQPGPAWPEVEGITIRNGNVPAFGGAVYCEGTLAMRNCIFESNRSDYVGGAITFYGSGYPRLVNCAFVGNEAGDVGGAIVIEGVELDVEIDSCGFYDNRGASGGAIACVMHEATAYIRSSLFVGNSAQEYGGAIDVLNMGADIWNCTFVANSAPTGSAIAGNTNGIYINTWVRQSVIAFNNGGSGYYLPHYYPWVTPVRCTNIYGNEGGDWADSLSIWLGIEGNFSADPDFCDSDFEPYDLRLCNCSPCLPGNHPDGYTCGLVGALGEGCICDPSSTQPSTWGAIKAMYR
jgi:hypothetical protein